MQIFIIQGGGWGKVELGDQKKEGRTNLSRRNITRAIDSRGKGRVFMRREISSSRGAGIFGGGIPWDEMRTMELRNEWG